MKTALLHYWLTGMRGGEKVLAALAGMYPDACVFTHAFRSGEFGDRGFFGHEVRESFIARLPFGRSKPQLYLPLMPAASRWLRLDGCDLVISSESGPVKGIRKPEHAVHICYCHTPMRYVWDMYEEYYRMAGIGGRLAMPLFARYMRYEDLKSAESVDRFIANSAFVAGRIRRIYGRESTVVHPPVDVEFFGSESSEMNVTGFPDGEYYLLAGQLVSYKRPDLAIAACVKLGRNIAVVGTGGMIHDLRRRYAGNHRVRFLGRVDDETLRAAYRGARALLFPGVEDFGIVPVEAQAAGTPVIAFKAGGALETVVENETGMFFSEQNLESLIAGICEFEAKKLSDIVCKENARRFSRKIFEKKLSLVVTECIHSHG